MDFSRWERGQDDSGSAAGEPFPRTFPRTISIAIDELAKFGEVGADLIQMLADKKHRIERLMSERDVDRSELSKWSAEFAKLTIEQPAIRMAHLIAIKKDCVAAVESKMSMKRGSSNQEGDHDAPSGIREVLERMRADIESRRSRLKSEMLRRGRKLW